MCVCVYTLETICKNVITSTGAESGGGRSFIVINALMLLRMLWRRDRLWRRERLRTAFEKCDSKSTTARARDEKSIRLKRNKNLIRRVRKTDTIKAFYTRRRFRRQVRIPTVKRNVCAKDSSENELLIRTRMVSVS